MPSGRPPRPLHLVLLGTLTLAALGGSCSGGDQRTAQPPELPRPAFRLAVVTDLQGYLEPCGCQSRPLGGVDKLATAIRNAGAERVPVLVVASGDVLFSGLTHGPAGAEAATQEIWKAETLADILRRIGVVAATPGARDLTQGAAELARIAGAAPIGWTAADVRLTAAPDLLQPRVLRDVGGIKVGIFGIAELEAPEGALPDGVERLAPARQAARDAAAALRREGAQVVIAMVSGSRRTVRSIAGGTEGVDFVIMSGVDAAEPAPPSRAGDAWVIHAGKQGQRVTIVDVIRRGDGAFADVSEWSRDSRRAQLDARIAELQRRIHEWERDPSVNSGDVEAQRVRLRELDRERGRLMDAATVPARGNLFSARAIELAPEVQGDAAIAAAMDRYDIRVNEHNRRAFANLVPEPAPPERPHYVGSQSCGGGGCHQAALDWWRGTPHGRAYATLVDRHKEFNLSCVGCHVTGYQEPGGSTVTHLGPNGVLRDVGCENCHGPGSAHVAAPQTDMARTDVPEQVCVECHNAEHSDQFVYSAYRQLLIVPGHGAPMP